MVSSCSYVRSAVRLSARSAARELIKDIDSPPTPIFDIARMVAPVVYTVDSGIGDAFCVRSRDGEYRIFIELGSKMPERVRYSTAHEVGHIVRDHYSYLKNKAMQLNVKIPKGFLLLWDEIPELAPFAKIADREAEIFAAEILMPLKWLRRPETANEFESLRRTLMVSKWALKIRLVETGIMSAEEVDLLLRDRLNGD